MIFETLSIFAGGIALIAVQPPLRRLFPPKVKQTQWEEFWSEEGMRTRWGGCSHTDVFDCLRAGCKDERAEVDAQLAAPVKTGMQCVIEQPVSRPSRVDLSGYAEVLRKQYLPQAKQALENSSQLMAEIKAAQKPDLTWICRDSAMNQRRKVTEEAERLGMQVYLDLATNQYGMRPKPSTAEQNKPPISTADGDYSVAALRLQQATLAQMENAGAAGESGLQGLKQALDAGQLQMQKDLFNMLRADGRQIDRKLWTDG